MIPWEVGKVEYTEEDAAAALGITVEHLRSLVRQHVTKDDQDPELPMPALRPTDLLLLKMLAQETCAV